jgi:hypothetical protein
MDQFERGDMVVRRAICGKQTTVELYEQYHKYHGCLGIVLEVKLQRPNQVNPPPNGEREKLYRVKWFGGSGFKDLETHWYPDYKIGHLDGRHRWN